MRKIEKQQLMNLINKVKINHSLIKRKRTDKTTLQQLFIQCQEYAIRIGNSIELSEGNIKIVSMLEQYCEQIYQMSILECYEDTFLEKNEDLLFCIERELYLISTEEKIEIVFFVYNASMWDCLESVWMAAKKDPDCRCFVVSIPYFDKDSKGKLTNMYLEDNKMPRYVPIIPWINYSLEDRRPDIGYIHNPYDQYNKVSSVHPFFYTDNLKKYVDKVIYIPYFIAATQYNTVEEAIKRGEENVMPSLFKVDKIIVQSEAYKYMLLCNGISEDKIEVLGSPKVDGVVNYKDHVDEIPLSWKEACFGKKVILLNSSLRDMINKKDYFELICNVFESVLNSNSLIMIWRLHPLYENTLRRLRPELLPLVMELVEIAKNNHRFILDNNASFYPSFLISDAMISDTSSLARIYLFTEKPIYYLYGSKNMKKAHYSLNYFESYFRLDNLTINDFLNMVNNDTDLNKCGRIKAAFESIANPYGNCGEEIHKKIMKYLRR